MPEIKFKIQNSKFKITNQRAKIISNKKIKDSYFELIIEAPEIAKYARPGQFVNIKVSEELSPLLRRPFSIHQIGKSQLANRKWSDGIKILYEVVGKGTEILAQRKAGEYLDTIGPLGNGFDDDGLRRRRMRLRRRGTPPQADAPTAQRGEGGRILVAGGMGTAPLVFLAEKLRARKSKEEGRGTIVLLGAKTKDDILCEKEFKKFGCEVKIATDDGTRGFKGYVTDLLKHLLRTTDYGLRTIYACGPKAMLKEISRLSREYNIPAQISLEAHIACGIGACMGCVIKTKDSAAGGCAYGAEGRRARDTFQYKRVCYEGPVFEANEVVW